MTHTYHISGMTCGSCEATVKSRLLMHPDVLEVEVSRENQTAVVTMDTHVTVNELQQALGGSESKYTIEAQGHSEMQEQTKSWFKTYRPILLIFGYITAVTVLIQFVQAEWNFMQWMTHFMAGFFLVFSFFKLLNLKGFAESYAMYDVIAKRWNGWGYVYAFIELGLGLAYLTDIYPLAVNAITFVVMSISLLGVLQSVLNKRAIQCACLGAVFDLPMSTVTIIEDALMIAMSAVTILIML